MPSNSFQSLNHCCTNNKGCFGIFFLNYYKRFPCVTSYKYIENISKGTKTILSALHLPGIWYDVIKHIDNLKLSMVDKSGMHTM